MNRFTATTAMNIRYGATSMSVIPSSKFLISYHGRYVIRVLNFRSKYVHVYVIIFHCDTNYIPSYIQYKTSLVTFEYFDMLWPVPL